MAGDGIATAIDRSEKVPDAGRLGQGSQLVVIEIGLCFGQVRAGGIGIWVEDEFGQLQM